MDWTCVLVLFLSLQLHLTPCTEAAFSVSLELQGDCSDQLTLICRHSDVPIDPNWIHNGTVESGDVLVTAFHGANYTVQTLTEHTATITGVDNVRALDGYVIQCVYTNLGNLVKSNPVKFSFIPPDYRPALSLVSFTSNFSERLSTFTLSYQESCSLYPRCTPYFSVEHTVFPQSTVSNSSSGCSVEYTIHNLMRCVSYQSNAIALLSNQRGNLVVLGAAVMQSPGQFTITDVSIGVDRNLINVTYIENEPDCLGYPTEWYTVDVDGVEVANLTANAGQSKFTDPSNGFQSLAINQTNGSVTLSLPLSQPLPEDAVTLNMTKYNTVPTNRSDDMGNIVTETVTWGTSAVFALRESPPGGESPAAGSDDEVYAGAIGLSVSVVIAVVILGGGGGTAVVVVVIKWRNNKKKERMLTDNPQQEEQGCTPTRGKRTEKEMEAERHAAQRPIYAELNFADQRPVPRPASDMCVAGYAEVSQA